MKKTLIIGMALGLALTATSAMAGSDKPGGSGIVGSYHDLATDSRFGGDGQSRICIFCHHPHQAQTNNASDTDARENGTHRMDYMPLWNHDVTTQTFSPYSNGNGPTVGRNALNAKADLTASGWAPGGVSLLCLSCHDGSVAINAYSNFSTAKSDGLNGASGNAIQGGTKTPGEVSRALIGGSGDLSNHHPIGFNYLNVRDADAEIADPSRVINSTGTTISDLLYGGTQFECVTCHDVHNSQNPGAEKFLWISNNNSNFCLTCHLKDGLSQGTATGPSLHTAAEHVYTP